MGVCLMRSRARIWHFYAWFSTRRERFRFASRWSIASMPLRRKAARVAFSVSRDKPRCCAIALFEVPSSASRMTRPRRATRCVVVPARASVVSEAVPAWTLGRR